MTDEPFEKHAGRNTGNLLDGAKDSVRDFERLDDPAKQQLREPLARVKNLMNERGDFIHAVYTSQVGSDVDQVMRTRLKTGSKSPVVDVVSAADLVALAARLLDLICDLGDALGATVPGRGFRPGTTFAPVRATIVGPS